MARSNIPTLVTNECWYTPVDFWNRPRIAPLLAKLLDMHSTMVSLNPAIPSIVHPAPSGAMFGVTKGPAGENAPVKESTR